MTETNPEPLKHVPPKSVIAGWDFSTGGVKCLAFDLEGNKIAEVRLPTDLWKGDPSQTEIFELNLMQLEGQARATVRALAELLRDQGRLRHWIAGGISATHHTAGRIDKYHNQVRRAICWNDVSLTRYHKIGLRRLGGQAQVQRLIGGPWAIRYTLSHLVKDEDPEYIEPKEKIWERTARILPHGALAGGYLTGNFDVISVSAAASTGLMDLNRKTWAYGMLQALADPAHRRLARRCLPRIVTTDEPLGPLVDHLALEAGIDPSRRPLLFPTSDDQQAGLVGGGAVESGQVAIVLGNSAVVNSSSLQTPKTGSLDVMRLNWSPYLWMRCYNNGAQFLNRVVGPQPDWDKLEAQGTAAPPGCRGSAVLPFEFPEPSLKVTEPLVRWSPQEPKSPGVRFRAALEALAYLIALGVRQHEQAGQQISQISVSGGIARSMLMCRILASVLNRPLKRLESAEGPALGAATTALAAYENHARRLAGDSREYTVADARRQMVHFREEVQPEETWVAGYQQQLNLFARQIQSL